MLKFLKSIVRSQFQCGSGAISRRRFLGLLSPLEKPLCKACSEDPATEGPYCVTCARRQMHVPAAKTVRAAIIIIALMSMLAAPAFAVEFQLTAPSSTFMTNGYSVFGTQKLYVPFYQYLTVDMNKLGAGFSVHASGWGRGDITSNGSGGDRGDGQLLYAYLQWQDPSNARRVLRLGRQFLYGGPSSMRSQYVDGAYFKSDIIAGLGVEVMGGSPVVSQITDRSGDYVAQGRLYHVWENRSEIGAGYRIARDDNQRSREDVGFDLWLNPFGKIEVLGYAIYDLIGEQFADANLTTAFFPVRKVKIAADVTHTIPALLLSHTSIFTVFSSSSYDKLSLGGTYFINDRWTADAKLQGFVYSDGSKLLRAGAEGGYRYGDKKQGKVALSAYRLEELQNGVTELRTYTNYRLREKLTCSLDLYGYLFDQQVQERNYSVTGIGNIGYQFIKRLKAVGSMYISRNPLFGHEYRGMVKLVADFGGTPDDA